MAEKNYDSTIMRIAGNLLSGSASAFISPLKGEGEANAIAKAVRMARAIVAEVQRPAEKEPK